MGNGCQMPVTTWGSSRPRLRRIARNGRSLDAGGGGAQGAFSLIALARRGRCFMSKLDIGEYSMFSHVFVGANDIAASKKFYDAALSAIGIPEGKLDPKGRIFYRTKSGFLGLTKPIDGKVATHANGGTIGFACDSPEK